MWKYLTCIIIDIHYTVWNTDISTSRGKYTALTKYKKLLKLTGQYPFNEIKKRKECLKNRNKDKKKGIRDRWEHKNEIKNN